MEELDLYLVDELLTDEERMVRDQVRAFASERLLPDIPRHWEAGTFPTEVVPEIAELGLFGITVPEEYGGAGLGAVAYGLACQELERVDSGIRSFVSVQSSLVMFPILAYGSEEQKRRWLPALASGAAIGCFGLTEPDAGSDPGGMRTRARRDGDDWVLNGQKMWITNGSIADVAVVWAKDEEDVVRGFLVETDRPGFSAPDHEHKWSLRASVTSELVLDEVRVPEANRLPEARGLRAPLSCLTEARYGIAWGGVGAAQACFLEARGYALERPVFARPLAAYQITQVKLADMASRITHGQLLSWRLGRLKEEGRATPTMVSLAKRDNVRMALDVAREARTILAANGITLEYHAGRHACNLESVLTYEGTEEVHTLVLGEYVTGIPAFRLGAEAAERRERPARTGAPS